MKKLLLIFLVFISACTEYCMAGINITCRYINSVNSGLPDNNIRQIAQLENGIMLLKSVYETYLYDGYTFRKATSEVPLFKSRTLRPNVIKDNMGNLCQFSDKGVLTYKDKVSGKQYHFNLVGGGTGNHLKRANVITTRNGVIWISTYGNGLFAFDKKDGELRHFSQKDAHRVINTDFIMAMAVDRNGCIWVSGEYTGLMLIKELPATYRVLKLRNDDEYGRDDEIRMLARLDSSTIIGADNDGHLFCSDENLCKIRFLEGGSLRKIRFISAAKDKNGRIWLGTRNDNLFIDGKQYKSPRTDIIHKARNGRMWLAGLGSGLRLATLYSDGSLRQRIIGWNGKNVRALLEASDGMMYVGTSSGLFCIDPNKISSNHILARRINTVGVMCLAESNDGSIVVGTRRHGLFVYDCSKGKPRLAKHLTTDDGLPANVLNSVTVNSSGNIIAGTINGIAAIDIKSGRIGIIRFDNEYERNFCRENSIIKLDNGDVAVGTLRDIVVVRKNFFAGQSKSINRPSLTGLLVNGTAVDKQDSVLNIIGKGEPLKLSHTHNTITAFCSDFNFASSSQTMFAFFLKGKDRQWSIMPAGNSVTYKDLSPGSYTLMAKYRTENGAWSDEAAVLPLVISPPLWATPWAYVLYAVLAMAVAFAVYRQLRYVYVLKQKIAVEKGITEFKLRFFTDISHEFRSPLTLINNAMQRIGEVDDVPAALAVPLQSMRSNVGRMSRLINQLVEFRRMQNGKLKLKLQKTDAIAFVYNIFYMFQSIAESKNINCSFTPDVESCTSYIDRGFVDKILYNVISNAFKYTPSGGSVSVRVKTSNNTLSVAVVDTGVGVSDDMRDRLFKRFETDNTVSDSIGIGLNFSQKLAEAHHGSLTYSPNMEADSGGSVFTLSIPISEESYTEDDYLKENAANINDEMQARRGYEVFTSPMDTVPMNNLRILVVEDDNDIAAMLKGELQQLFEVRLASNGNEALELVNKDKSGFKLIISDVMMPGIDGYKLAKTIRQDKSLPYIPIILLTALDSPEAEARGINCGADAYIVKPFNMNVLKSYCISFINRYADFDGPQRQEESGRKVITTPKLVTDMHDKRFVDAFTMFVLDNISDESLSADTIAKAFKLGRTSFYNKVQRLMGKSPADFIKECRMDKAAQMLIESDDNIAEISYSVGYKKPQYFATVFKSHFGLTPKEYRKRAYIAATQK